MACNSLAHTKNLMVFEIPQKKLAMTNITKPCINNDISPNRSMVIKKAVITSVYILTIHKTVLSVEPSSTAITIQ